MAFTHPSSLLTERSIINFLIWIGGLILGPYLAISALEGNFAPTLVVAAIAFLVFIFGVGRDKICFLPLFGIFISGRFNFLPLRLAPSDLCSLALVIYYIVAYIALQRKITVPGADVLFLPIVIIASIVLYHQRGSGLRAMGGGEEGARGCPVYFTVLHRLLLRDQSVNTPAPSFFARIPPYALGAAILSGIPSYPEHLRAQPCPCPDAGDRQHQCRRLCQRCHGPGRNSCATQVRPRSEWF